MADPGARLIQRIAAGDRGALAELYALHGSALLRYLVQLSGDPELAQELLQETLLAIWRSAPSFEGRSTARTWCFGIARRRLRDARRRPLHLDDPWPQDSEDLASPEISPEDAALERMEIDQMARAVSELPILQREVLTLIFVDGFTGPEAASILNVPDGTVKSRLNAARRTLRARLRPGSDG